MSRDKLFSCIRCRKSRKVESSGSGFNSERGEQRIVSAFCCFWDSRDSSTMSSVLGQTPKLPFVAVAAGRRFMIKINKSRVLSPSLTPSMGAGTATGTGSNTAADGRGTVKNGRYGVGRVVRLPVKSLIQFRWVCKAWKSLIDSSPFIADHNSEENFVCFVDDDDCFPQNKFAPAVPPIFRLFWPFNTTIHSSCGLLCLEGFLREPDNSETQTVVLWNPSIRKSIAIVVPNDDAPSRFVYAATSRVFPFVGFGVCPETKDPKLNKISSRNDDENQVRVFTLSSREWRCLSSNHLPRKSLEFNNYSHTVIGRFLYGLAFDGEFYLTWSFDFSTDEFREVPLPDSLRRSYLDMSKVRESLVLIHDNDGYFSSTNIDVFDVWMMMEDGAFTKLFAIKKDSVERILGFKNKNASIERILGFKNKHVELMNFCTCESPYDLGCVD
ncbi:hypothetical protein OSB04_014962 [Centaurea solstitialis]|uniref:F-box associated beta-propeller type 1 domain-containing protein n=1 Tax=Centaurea solstitialis TaxID=347529 RepID=A0AA38TGC2_9ASTR|nr:hypothetical protein OSB04_014962 [Centaurea solstitialis]